MKRFFSIISSVAAALIGACALFVLGSIVPFEGNYSFRIVESGSMEPTIRTGSIVAVIPRDTYGIGDIVLFDGTSVNPKPTTHRIVGTTDGQFVTKGDANEDVDYRRITENEILGKVFLDVPYVGYAATYFGTPAGRAVLVAVAIVTIAVAFLPWGRMLRRREASE